VRAQAGADANAAGSGSFADAGDPDAGAPPTPQVLQPTNPKKTWSQRAAETWEEWAEGQKAQYAHTLAEKRRREEEAHIAAEYPGWVEL